MAKKNWEDSEIFTELKVVEYNALKKTVGKNLFNKNNLASSSGQINRGYGTIDQSDGYSVSNYIILTPGATIKANKFAEWTSFAYYNINKQFIGIEWSTLNPVIVPPNAIFGRFTIDNSQIDEYQIEVGELSTPYENGVENYKTVNYESFSEILRPIIERRLTHLTTFIPSKIRNANFITVQNGGVLLSNKKGLKIPAGSTGQNSVFSVALNPSATEIKDFGDKYIVGRWAFKYTGDSLGSLLRMDMGIGGLIGGNSNLSRTEDAVNNTVYFECEKFVASSFSLSTLCYCIVNNTVALTNDYTIEFVGFSIKEATLEDRNPLQNLLGGDVYAEKMRGIYNANNHTTTITCKRNGTSGIDADFCGLNAIGAALASITDASEFNKYKIFVDGIFAFTLPSDFVYSDVYAEPTVIIGKDYVDIEGMGIGITFVSVEFADDVVFPDGKAYDNYQPVMWACNSTLKNISIIGKNCRYSLHIEGGVGIPDKTLQFENLDILFKGNQAIGGYGGACLGTGFASGSTWKFKNISLWNQEGAVFGFHTSLSAVEKGGSVIFERCDFNGSIGLSIYPFGRNVEMNYIDCTWKKKTPITYSSVYIGTSNNSDYSEIKIRSNHNPILFDNSGLKGLGLRIKSKSTGVNSKVRFSESCTAFNSIIGFSVETVESVTNWYKTYQFGYEYEDGAVGSVGYAIGHKDVDPSTPHVSLGKNLGDCSSVNKILTVTIDGTTYNVVFNTNCTPLTNAQIITLITNVIGTVADVDTYNISQNYYPEFKGNMSLINADASPILSGMGIIMTSSNSMRIALNSDNRIDGICLDDTTIGGIGRIISRGEIYSLGSNKRFAIKEIASENHANGVELGISAITPGVFDKNASPKLLRAFDTNSLMIM